MQSMGLNEKTSSFLALDVVSILGAVCSSRIPQCVRLHPATVATVTEQEITVIYPPDPQSGGQMTKDVIPQAECVPEKLRARL
eukprot:COSAG02_NODE_42316_length_385_cov_1.391608_1_plen_82_part_10